MTKNKNFLRNKTILVTGHTGFKGGWLSLWLKSFGAKIIGYSLNPITKKNLPRGKWRNLNKAEISLMNMF